MLQRKRDSQKQRVYKWEESFLPAKDHSLVPFDNIQGIVNYIWQNENLQYPPIVKKKLNGKKHIGFGSRTKISFNPVPIPTWIIIHELTHSLTSNLETSAGHNEDFVGMYIYLLSKYLNIPMSELTESLDKSCIRYNLNVRPWFI